MTFREAVQEASKVLIKARGKSFKTTKKEIWNAIEKFDWDTVLDEPMNRPYATVKIYSHAFDFNGVHLNVFCWEEGTVLEVNLTPSYA